MLVQNLESKIAELKSKAEQANALRSASIGNPACDMGGIRSMSAKRKSQRMDRTIDLACSAVALYKEIEKLEAYKSNYAKAQRLIESATKVLESGMLKGAPLTKDQRKEIELIRKDSMKTIARIERANA
jgi:hypothetical protein